MNQGADPHLATYVADRDKKLRADWYINYGDLGALSMAIKQAAWYLRDHARPDSELAGFVEPLLRFSEVIHDATEAMMRRKCGVHWEIVHDLLLSQKNRGGK